MTDYSNKQGFSVVDLFAGCGGLSEGFEQKGFNVIAQVEMDGWACETLRTRHLYYALKRTGRAVLYNKYLRGEISRAEILKNYPEINKTVSARVIQATLGDGEKAEILKRLKKSKSSHTPSRFHVLLGGPPCQPYSLAGRSRDPDRMEKDDRNFLYRRYLEILNELKPDFFVYENVPGLFSAKADGSRVFERIIEDFASLNPPYEITPPLQQIYKNPGNYIVKSSDFFVPQNRRRLILIGYREDVGEKNPDVKDIFSNLQQLAIKNSKKTACSVRDAIADLPSLKPGDGNDGWYGSYQCSEPGPYQKKMRRGSPGILNHRARTHMESDLDRYRYFIEQSNNGNGRVTLNDLKDEKPHLLPAHKHLDKFIDRFKVQQWERPSSTITAHISKDGHYFIHPDIKQCRSFTVREAARCQSFPDNYKFEGPRTEQFKQVGNAVPPVLSCVIAELLKRELEKIYGNE